MDSREIVTDADTITKMFDAIGGTLLKCQQGVAYHVWGLFLSIVENLNTYFVRYDWKLRSVRSSDGEVIAENTFTQLGNLIVKICGFNFELSKEEISLGAFVLISVFLAAIGLLIMVSFFKITINDREFINTFFTIMLEALTVFGFLLSIMAYTYQNDLYNKSLFLWLSQFLSIGDKAYLTSTSYFISLSCLLLLVIAAILTFSVMFLRCFFNEAFMLALTCLFLVVVEKNLGLIGFPEDRHLLVDVLVLAGIVILMCFVYFFCSGLFIALAYPGIFAAFSMCVFFLNLKFLLFIDQRIVERVFSTTLYSRTSEYFATNLPVVVLLIVLGVTIYLVKCVQMLKILLENLMIYLSIYIKTENLGQK